MSKPSGIVKPIEKRIMTFNPLAIFYYFALTVLIVRGTIFVAVSFDHIPAVFIRGLHVHHFVFGFLLVLLALDESRNSHVPRFLLELALGIGLALMFDEFAYWSLLRFDYWSGINLVAVSLLGIAGGIASRYDREVYKLRLFRHKPQTHPHYSFRWHVLLPWTSFVCLLLILYRLQ